MAGHVIAILAVPMILFGVEIASLWVDGSIYFNKPGEYFRDQAPKFATFRPWEVWDQPAYGDMANMTGVPELRIPLRERFVTDEYGFRNQPGQFEKHPRIVITGRSFGVGSHISDEDLLDHIVETQLGEPVYNASHENVSDWIHDQRFIDFPPKILILFHIESDLKVIPFFNFDPSGANFSPHRYSDHREFERELTKEYLRKEKTPLSLLKQYSQQAGRDSLLNVYASDFFKSLQWQLGLYHFPKDVYFYNPGTMDLFHRVYAEEAIDSSQYKRSLQATVRHLEALKNYLKIRGTEILIIPAPTKEAIDAEMLPGVSPDHVFDKLEYYYKLLDAAGVSYVPVHRALRDYKRLHPNEPLYFVDDTHINGLGHRIIFDASKDKIRELLGTSR
jgi:hypothetical protein